MLMTFHFSIPIFPQAWLIPVLGLLSYLCIVKFSTFCLSYFRLFSISLTKGVLMDLYFLLQTEPTVLRCCGLGSHSCIHPGP